MSNIGFSDHNHHNCIVDGMAAVEAQCSESGLKFTPIRRRVLEILLEEHRALGAYEILDILRKDGMGSQPPVAYRALDFLSQNGFVHKIERLNAFVACSHPDSSHAPTFMICRLCHSVAEGVADPDMGELTQSASEAGFQIEQVVVEAEGICPKCQDTV